MADPSVSPRIQLIFEKIANIIISIVLVALIVLFIYLFSRFSLIKPISRVLVFILPFLGLALILILRSARFKVITALIIISTFFPLYFFELIQWPWMTSNVSSSGSNKLMNEDIRTDMEVLRDLRQEGRDANLFVALTNLMGVKKFEEVFPIHTKDKEVLPLGGPSLKTTVVCKEGKYWTVYDSDEHGFHNPKGMYKPGDVDVALLGDSAVQGYCVSEEGNIAAFLRKAYPKTFNFGVGGAGTLIRLAIFREYVEVLKPKLVFWVYTENTLRRIENEGLLRKYLDQGYRQGLYSLQAEIDQGYQKIMSIAENVRGGNQLADRKWVKVLLLKKTQEDVEFFIHEMKLLRQKKAIMEDDRKVLEKSLLDAKLATEQWGGKFVFVYLPTALGQPISDHDFIVLLAKSLSIPVVDLSQIFDDIKDPLMIHHRKDGHLNEYGYSRVAEHIMQAIQENPSWGLENKN